MKKLILVLICIVLALGIFASCGKESAPKAAPLAEVYASLEQVTNMPAMEIMPDALIETLFGFDLSKFEEYVFAEAADPSVNADTIILVKLKDSADLTATCDVLDSYLYSVKENTQSYSPVNFAKTQKSAVSVIDQNYIYLIITSEYAEAEQVIIEAIQLGHTDSVIQTLVEN